MKRYRLAEKFYSIQGEGVLAGTPMFFVRFAGCNLKCSWCDTDHVEQFQATAGEIVTAARQRGVRWVCLTGGEPALQADAGLVDVLHAGGIKVAIETNGTLPLPPGIDWVTVSPKPEGVTVVRRANEVRYAMAASDSLPCPLTDADHYLLSPIFDGPNPVPENVAWCVKMVKENPTWRLSVQTHKLIDIR